MKHLPSNLPVEAATGAVVQFVRQQLRSDFATVWPQLIGGRHFNINPMTISEAKVD